MSKKQDPERDPESYAGYVERPAQAVDNIPEIIRTFMDNNQSPRSLEIVKKDRDGTDVLTVRVTPK